MKKSLAALLLLALMAVLCTGAGAEESREMDLFDLWDYGAESMTWLSSAVPVSEGALIVSASVIPENREHLAVSDGKTFWDVEAVLTDDEGLLSVVFYDPEGDAVRYGSWPLLPWGDSVPAVDCIVRSGDAMGSRINRGVLSAEDCIFRGRRCLLLTLSGPAVPGSPVLTADGELAGMIVAEWAEGMYRVLALTPEEIAYTLAATASRLHNLPAWQDPPEGLTVTMQKNLVTVSWKDMVLPEKNEGETLYLVVLDTGNDYLRYYPAETEKRSFSLLLTPGRYYLAGMTACAGVPDGVPDRYAVFGVPEAQPLTDHHFRPLRTTIAEAPQDGLKNGEAPVPVSEVTEELLRSGRAYFYSASSYEVSETIEGITLLITLTDPDGVNYSYETGWVYGPEYMSEDIWYLPLRDTGLLEGAEQKDYPKGVYHIAYYVDGDLADAFEFELK